MKQSNNKQLIQTIWSNIEYYTEIRGMYKKDVYRSDRYGKGIALTGLMEIAEILEVPLELLLETDKEITLEVAYAMVCKDLGVTRRELEQALSFKREIKKVIKNFE